MHSPSVIVHERNPVFVVVAGDPPDLVRLGIALLRQVLANVTPCELVIKIGQQLVSSWRNRKCQPFQMTGPPDLTNHSLLLPAADSDKRPAPSAAARAVSSPPAAAGRRELGVGKLDAVADAGAVADLGEVEPHPGVGRGRNSVWKGSRASAGRDGATPRAGEDSPGYPASPAEAGAASPSLPSGRSFPIPTERSYSHRGEEDGRARPV